MAAGFLKRWVVATIASIIFGIVVFQVAWVLEATDWAWVFPVKAVYYLSGAVFGTIMFGEWK